MTEARKYGTAETHRRMRRTVRADVFKQRKNYCSYALDTRHFSVDKDRDYPVPTVRLNLKTQEETARPIHGVPKSWGTKYGGIQVQCVQEVGAISPMLEPFSKSEDLVKCIGIFYPGKKGPSIKAISDWVESSPLAKKILHGDHPCKTVPLTVVSELVGMQSIQIAVPGCRISGKMGKHFHSAYCLIGGTLQEDMVFMLKHYTCHRAFGTVSHKLPTAQIIRASFDMLSNNLQFLLLLMLVNPITSHGQSLITSYPPPTAEILVLEGLLLKGKNPRDYCLIRGKSDHKTRQKQYCINNGDDEDESSEDEGSVPIVKGLNHVEEKSFHRAAKRIMDKGEGVFRKQETREKFIAAMEAIRNDDVMEDSDDEPVPKGADVSTSTTTLREIGTISPVPSGSSSDSMPELEPEMFESLVTPKSTSPTGSSEASAKKKEKKTKTPTTSRKRKGVDPRLPVAEPRDSDDSDGSVFIEEPSSHREEEVEAPVAPPAPKKTPGTKSKKRKHGTPATASPGDFGMNLSPRTLGLSASEARPSVAHGRARRQASAASRLGRKRATE